MTPKRFRKKPIEIEAMQWDYSEKALEELGDWTADVIERNEDGSPRKTTCWFMLLISGWDDLAREVLGGDDVDARLNDEYAAVVYDRLHGTWVNVADGDWIIKGVQGEFYPCRPDVFAATYEAVTRDD